jgi:hypothetical protein
VQPAIERDVAIATIVLSILMASEAPPQTGEHAAPAGSASLVAVSSGPHSVRA